MGANPGASGGRTPRATPPGSADGAARFRQAGRIGFAIGVVASFAAWDEGHPRLAFLLPFLGAGVGALLVRIYAGSERPRVEWPPDP